MWYRLFICGFVLRNSSIQADNLSGTVTACVFDHQSYADSTGYSLRLDGDVWHSYNSDNQIDYDYDGLAQNEYG